MGTPCDFLWKMSRVVSPGEGGSWREQAQRRMTGSISDTGHLRSALYHAYLLVFVCVISEWFSPQLSSLKMGLCLLQLNTAILHPVC